MPFIAELRGVLDNLETQIDNVCSMVEQVPLSDYEKDYLSKFEGYQEFKKRYIVENNATESDAQYVALAVHYGINDNPLFNDSLKNSQETQSLLTDISRLKSKLPDSRLHSLIELLIEVKKRQSVSDISHKLNPARWKAYVSDIKRRDDVEHELSNTIRKVKRWINRRLTQLADGAKYE